MVRVISDELNSMCAALCAKNAGINQADVARLVRDVYQVLASQARITTHLIPLTLNISRRRLAGILLAAATEAYEPSTSTSVEDFVGAPPANWIPIRNAQMEHI